MKRWPLVGVIVTITFSTLFVEVLLTRVLSVVYYGHTAFLIISLALFGYGLSGVYLSVSKLARRDNALHYLQRFLLGFALSLPVVYKLVLMLRIDFLHLFNPISNFLFLWLTFLLLVIPFFFGGVVLALIFSLYSREIGRLYFIDLAGAAVGSLAVIPLIPILGPNRILLLVSFLLFFGWCLLSRMRWIRKTAVIALVLLSFAWMYRNEDAFFPIMPVESKGENKRFFPIQKINKRIEFSRWSTINMIDVAPWFKMPRPRKVIWINGGTMQSYIYQFDGNLKNLAPILWEDPAVPYQMAERKGSALIIGSAGGYEVLCALSHRFMRIVAVEMDPVICSLLKKEYAGYCGDIFHLPQVTLLADEGRSVLQRMKRTFDVIQMVNSHNTDELLSGALSVSETYIFTVEGFKDYWRKLNDDGYLYIIHWMSERLLTTGIQALREMGVPEPEKRFFIIQKRYGDQFGFAHFIMKKGKFSANDYRILYDLAGEGQVAYTPEKTKDNFFYDIARDMSGAIKRSSVNIAPVTDQSPYFNQPNKIGQMGFKNMMVTGVARELVPPNMIFSNSIYLSILGLTLVFSFLFIYLPLKLRGGRGKSHPLIPYFFLIGIAFITVEIISIKIFQLFLGSPAISISVIIFSLLVSSGVGSLVFGRMGPERVGRLILIVSIVLGLLLVIYGLVIFSLLHLFLSLPFFGRFGMTALLLFVPGFLMGQFFPYGIRVLGEQKPEAIGWAWGANAFATVLGSILTVIISINWGFTFALFAAAVCYLVAGWSAWRLQKTGN